MNKFKKGDTVLVTTGKDKGKSGKIKTVFPKKEQVVVESLNMIKRHLKPTQESAGQIAETEGPIHWSNVALYDPKAKKAIKVKIGTENKSRVRQNAATGKAID